MSSARLVAALLGVVSAGGAATWIAASDLFIPALQVAGYAAASVGVVGMGVSRRGPLHWLAWASIQAQAICLGVREEVSAAVRSGVAEHANRVRRVKEWHA